jgi:hypothetical protein
VINDQTPQERIAAARLLYSVLKDYLDRPTWTPIEGALILSGMHAPAGCIEFPREGMGLDGKPFKGDVVDRWIKAREIMRLWEWRCEGDEENGTISPTQLAPHEFIAWCQDFDVETEWMRLLFEVISGGKVQTDQPDLIPLAVAEYVAQAGVEIKSEIGRTGAAGRDSNFEAVRQFAYEKVREMRPPQKGWHSRADAARKIKSAILQYAKENKIRMSDSDETTTIYKWLKAMPDADELFPNQKGVKKHKDAPTEPNV